MQAQLNCILMIVFVYFTGAFSTANAECTGRFCIGVILPLSRFTEYGVAMKNGIELARSKGEAKIKNLAFEYEDSAFDTKMALSAFRKLVEIDKVNLVYVLGGPMSEAVAPVADRLRIPTLTSSTDPVTAIAHPYIIRFANPAKDHGDRLAAELMARNLRHIAVLITENQYLNSLLEAIQRSTVGPSKVEVIHRGAGDSMDFKSAIAQIKGGKFDAIGVFLYPGQISQFYKQVRQQQLSLPTFGSDAFESNAEIAASGSAIEGAFFANNGVSEEFRGAYSKKYGNDHQISFAGLGFDLAMFLAEQFGETNSLLGPEGVIKTLMKRSDFDGISGRVQVVKDTNGDRFFRFPVRIRKVADGKIVTVG